MGYELIQLSDPEFVSAVGGNQVTISLRYRLDNNTGPGSNDINFLLGSRGVLIDRLSKFNVASAPYSRKRLQSLINTVDDGVVVDVNFGKLPNSKYEFVENPFTLGGTSKLIVDGKATRKKNFVEVVVNVINSQQTSYDFPFDLILYYQDCNFFTYVVGSVQIVHTS